ncbi:MAG: EamA family transporter [Caulobacterales bacterium]|nr:EamA family transporter [Caulobacterales bacterium]
MDQVNRRAPAFLLPLIALLAAMACFQLGASFAKGLFPAVGPEGAATLRIGLAAVMLLAVARPWRDWPKQAPLLPLLGLGLSSAGAMVMFYKAISHLPQGVAIALQFLGPLSIAVLGSRRHRDLAWAVLAAAGVWALVGHGAGSRPLDLVGVAWALGAAAAWAGYILWGRAAGATFGKSAAALATTVAAVLVLPVGVAHAGLALLSPGLIPLALAVALFSTAVPFSLELYAMPRLPARTFSVFTSLEPALGALSGFVLLHEALSLSQLAGLAAVIAAAAGAAWSTTREAAPALS